METGIPGSRATPELDGALVAAFGLGAGSGAAAGDPEGRAWLRAVALAGRGRFAAARALSATIRTGAFGSAARCLEASMLRQSGGHRRASGSDGAAWALAAGLPGVDAGLAVAVRVDALVGLAADALGVGRFALAAAMLARADTELEAADAGVEWPWWTVPRAALRRDWVAAELAIYSGDTAGAGRSLTALIDGDPGSAHPRHHAKTQLIAASAAAASGDVGRATELARTAYAIATEGGFDPLQWAGAKLMTALSDEVRGQRFAREAATIEAKWIRDGAEMGRL
ncbi:hypothetical protein [Tsukamurella strandjordii]|uniref:Uncharacterized protein n=1 Tax=Tsukamurella strandjordii TaxID=147577 RepID=A0AA90N816_9ACTN|nr:hypothetical protein [Tsukamurella strandjordii]MDP0396535.1 hypothetical protein [Tsukamurella strandjordii]